MVITLALDASWSIGTAAVLKDGRVVEEREAAMKGENEERLMPAVLAAVQGAGCAVRDIERVVCGGGPGSFTSLRIAGAIAKGIVLGRADTVPLYAVSSLALIVAGNVERLGAGRWLALLDAMRGERYASVVEVGNDHRVIERERVGIVSESEISAACERLGARPVGPREVTEAAPHARGVAVLLDAIVAGGPVELDRWEPEYGRLAEAQARWEAAHGRPLAAREP